MDTRENETGTSKRTGTSAVGALLALCLLAMSAVGCVGGGESVGRVEATLDLEAEPLETIEEAAWIAAPGCEGLVNASVSFRVASLVGGLVACVDESGEVICVDSVEAISSDLDESGREADADALAQSFFAAVHAEEMAVAISGMSSDPEPQPNNRPRGIGDPEPQPN